MKVRQGSALHESSPMRTCYPMTGRCVHGSGSSPLLAGAVCWIAVSVLSYSFLRKTGSPYRSSRLGHLNPPFTFAQRHPLQVVGLELVNSPHACRQEHHTSDLRQTTSSMCTPNVQTFSLSKRPRFTLVHLRVPNFHHQRCVGIGNYWCTESHALALRTSEAFMPMGLYYFSGHSTK